MLNSLNSFLVIFAVGALLSLSFLLITNPLRVNKKANRIFGIFLLLWATFWIEEVSAFIKIDLNGTYFLMWIQFVQFFTPISLFYSIKYFTKPYLRLSKLDLLHLVIPSFALILLLQVYNEPNKLYRNILVVLMLTQAFLYVFLSLLLLKKHENNIKLINADIESIDMNWIKKIIIGLFFISIFMTLYTLIVNENILSIFGNIMLLASILFTAYHAIQQEEIFLLNKEEVKIIFESDSIENRSKTKLISDKDMKQLRNELVMLMQEKKPYLQNDLSLSKLADLMQITPHQLSYLLNSGFNENFFLFVNKYRVEEAKKLLVNSKYDYLSVIGIGFEAGFNSKTAFNTVFKKITGTTPSSFKKMSSQS